MQEWEHKERYYHYDNNYQDFNGINSRTRKEESQTFSSWLDWQCKGGWELFKIFRDHQNGKNNCIFRRLV